MNSQHYSSFNADRLRGTHSAPGCTAAANNTHEMATSRQGRHTPPLPPPSYTLLPPHAGTRWKLLRANFFAFSYGVLVISRNCLSLLFTYGTWK